MNTTHHNYSTAHTYLLHSQPWICGMPLAGLWSCLKRGGRRWRLSRDEGGGESTLHRMGSGSTPPPPWCSRSRSLHAVGTYQVNDISTWSNCNNFSHLLK